jgi:hypothetical protein
VNGRVEVKKLVIVSMLACAACFAPMASAEDVKIEVKASTTMRDVLVDNTGKRVALRLASGEEIEGTVTTVGNSLVHLSRLSGKEFYDAVVGIDKISAVRLKARDK